MRMHRTALKVCLLAAALLPGQIDKAAALPVPWDGNAPLIAGQTYYPEVRLRKVHLVRPDLIFYPLDFEIFC